MQSDSSDSPGFGGLGSSGSRESSPGFGGRGSPILGGSGESSPGFGGSGSPNFGGSGESSPGFGGRGSDSPGSPNFGGSGGSSPDFGGPPDLGGLGSPILAGSRESSPRDGGSSVEIIEVVDHLSARMSSVSLELSDHIPPFSWDGILSDPVVEESRVSLRYFDETLEGFADLNQALFSECKIKKSLDTCILTLSKDPKYVEVTTVKDTVAATVKTYVWAQLFIAPISALGELLLEADRNALLNPSMDDPTTLRGTCLDIPDMTVQMHRHYKVVDGLLVTGVQIWLPPTFFGNGLDKFLAYVLRA